MGAHASGRFLMRTMTKRLDVAIIGAGIGGLTAALALQQRSIRVRVFERAPVLREVGAGIQISPNATRIMESLGLGQALADVSSLPESLVMRDGASGRTILEVGLGASALQRYGYPYFHVHRGDLHGVLLKAVLRNDPHAVVTGAHCVSVLNLGGSVELKFSRGEGAEADLVVGADGLQTIVGDCLFGPQRPRFTGNVAWRGLVPVERIADLKVPTNLTVWVGPGRHMVQYKVRQGGLVNFAAVVEEDGWTKESWTEQGDKSVLLDQMRDWAPEAQALVEAATEVFRWALFDRDPRESWSLGRVTLLGDAAHPMLPFLAQGAAMAIEDAYVLADCVASAVGPEHALAQYESIRRERTARVQLGARANAGIFHMKVEPGAAEIGDDPRRFSDEGRDIASLDWLYGYDAVAQTAQMRLASRGLT